MTKIVEFPHRSFLSCHDCGVLHPAVHRSGLLTGEAEQAALEAFQEFATAHSAHATTLLQRSGHPTGSTGPLWDPLAPLTFEVTDGLTTFVVQADRVSIDEPRRYRFSPGRLALNAATVSIDDAAVRAGLDHAWFPHALRLSTIERFVELLREIIAGIDAEGLDIAFDDADDPSVSIAAVPPAACESLLAGCAVIFDAADLPLVRSFVAGNCDADGVLALRVRQDHRVLAA
jgi:hypothetical protein